MVVVLHIQEMALRVLVECDLGKFYYLEGARVWRYFEGESKPQAVRLSVRTEIAASGPGVGFFTPLGSPFRRRQFQLAGGAVSEP